MPVAQIYRFFFLNYNNKLCYQCWLIWGGILRDNILLLFFLVYNFLSSIILNKITRPFSKTCFFKFLCPTVYRCRLFKKYNNITLKKSAYIFQNGTRHVYINGISTFPIYFQWHFWCVATTNETYIIQTVKISTQTIISYHIVRRVHRGDIFEYIYLLVIL